MFLKEEIIIMNFLGIKKLKINIEFKYNVELTGMR